MPLATPRRPLLRIACGLAALALVASARPAVAADPFELVVGQRLMMTGQVAPDADAPAAGVAFDYVPTSLLSSKNYYNPFTGMVENRPVPGNPHPIPLLKAPHVSTYADKPDVARLAMDQVRSFGGRSEFGERTRYAVVADNDGNVRLLAFASVTVPQDKTGDWKLVGTSEPMKLVEHFDDPVADRGRAVETKEPLALKGKLLYATRKQSWGDAEVMTLDLPGGEPKKVADAAEPRFAANGTIVDRVNMRAVRITAPSGDVLGKIEFENDEVQDLAVTPDGKRIALCMERMVEVPDALPKRETAVIIYTAAGKKTGEFVGYDDPGFFPDGRVVLTDTDARTGVYVGDLKTGKVTRLKLRDSDGKTVALPSWPRDPVVSPDGRRIAFLCQRNAYVMNADGSDVTPLWVEDRDQRPQESVAFSPDGRYVSAVVVPLNVMSGPGKVVVFDLEKHVRQEVENSQDVSSQLPVVWQP